MSRECGTKSRDKVAYAAIVQLHAAKNINKALFSYNSMSCSVFGSDHSISKLNKLKELYILTYVNANNTDAIRTYANIIQRYLHALVYASKCKYRRIIFAPTFLNHKCE